MRRRTGPKAAASEGVRSDRRGRFCHGGHFCHRGHSCHRSNGVGACNVRDQFSGPHLLARSDAGIYARPARAATRRMASGLPGDNRWCGQAARQVRKAHRELMRVSSESRPSLVRVAGHSLRTPGPRTGPKHRTWMRLGPNSPDETRTRLRRDSDETRTRLGRDSEETRRRLAGRDLKRFSALLTRLSRPDWLFRNPVPFKLGLPDRDGSTRRAYA
jgi:hypothetical protein